MRIARIISILLSACLLFCACAQQDPPPSSSDDAPIATPDNGGDQTDTKDPEADGNGTVTPSVLPAELDVELTVEWEKVDTLLPQLDELSDLLRSAMEEVGCPLDRATITISTAGGFTAEALAGGGIDAAVIPAVDIISYRNKTSVVALSSEEIPETAIAVSKANEALSEAFSHLLLRALTETDAGQEFLTICCGTAAFSVPTEESLQAVRDHLAEQENTAGGLPE